MGTLTQYISHDGYVFYQHYHDGESEYVREHRLIAVAEYGFDAIKGKDIHHKNGIRLDNRVENLEPLTRKEHHHVHYEDIHERQPYWERETLEELYLDEKMSVQDVASKFGCYPRNICYWLNRHGIETRSPVEQRSINLPDRTYPELFGSPTGYRDKGTLEELYLENNWTQKQIADKYDVSQTIVAYWMDRHGIETRTKQSDDANYTDKEWLREQYVELGKSQTKIAEEEGVYQSTISKWLDRFDMR